MCTVLLMPVDIGIRFIIFLQDTLHRITRSRTTSMSDFDYLHLPSLFPDGAQICTVRVWLNSLLLANFGGNTQVHVVKIAQLKFKNGQEHEKTVVKLRVIPGDGKPELFTWVTTERGAEIDDMGHSSASLPALPNACASCAVYTLLSTAEISAMDRVVVPPAPHRLTYEDFIKKQLGRKHLLLCEITPTRTMTLPQLAVLLDVIHTFSSQYTSLKYNCYWYTFTIGEVICREFQGNISQDKHIARRGLYGSIQLRKEDSVDQVIEACKEAWAEMDQVLADKERARKDIEAGTSRFAELERDVEQAEQEWAREKQEREQAERALEQALEQAEQEREREKQERERAERELERAQLDREREKLDRERAEQALERAQLERLDHEMRLEAALREVASLQAQISQKR